MNFTVEHFNKSFVRHSKPFASQLHEAQGAGSVWGQALQGLAAMPKLEEAATDTQKNTVFGHKYHATGYSCRGSCTGIATSAKVWTSDRFKAIQIWSPG